MLNSNFGTCEWILDSIITDFFTSLFPDNPLMYTFSTIFSAFSLQIADQKFKFLWLFYRFAPVEDFDRLFWLERTTHTKKKKIEWIWFYSVFSYLVHA